MLILFNAIGLLILTGLFIGYIQINNKYGSHKRRNEDDNNDGGFDLGLPKIDLPPGSGLNAWQTDRILDTKWQKVS
jgi:cbb3-type cytochrome oxidase subunit 3